MQRLIPKVFFDTIEDGLELFEGCLGWTVLYRDADLAVVGRDGMKAYVVAGPDFAARDRPELAIETDTIDALFVEIATRCPERLHPNLNVVTQRSWGAREFAVLDRTGVCVVFRQWPG